MASRASCRPRVTAAPLRYLSSQCRTFGLNIEQEFHFVLNLERTGCGRNQLDAIVGLPQREAPGGAQYVTLHRQIGGYRVVLGNAMEVQGP
jgi:hypothetical protein